MLAARELRNCGDENQRALRSKSTCASKTTSVHKYGDAATLSAGRNRFLPRNCRSLVSTSAAAVCLKSKRACRMWMTRHFSNLAEVLKVQLQELFPTRPPGNRIYDFLEK